ncbi:MAG: RagB/SusD family nutrient uptake outer membrane protein [Bacteroidales bacterium]|nr:RagB/SusD family nutrient uptake outer membrane protein [Bacteroidales bacterium]
MKKIYMMLLMVAGLFAATSCDDFLEVKPSGTVDEELAFSDPEGMVTAAYASLGADWYNYPFNLWPYGSLSSDDAMKGGSGTTDTNYHPVEVWSNLTASQPDHMDELWYRLYVSISRSNRAILALQEYGEEKLGAETARVRMGEVKFLRAHFYFKILQLWYQAPWIDENVLAEAAQEQTPNNEFTHEELMQKVIADFEEAYNSVPERPADKARVNKYAAAAMLAKCYLTLAYGDGYEATNGYSHINQQYMQKVVEYTTYIANSGRFGYEADFGDIFMEENEGNCETIFAVQHSDYLDDNTKFGRNNWSNMLNGCWGIWSKGWDFHKPTQNLVNAFKVDDNGFPMFDTYDNEHNIHPVNGIPVDQKWDPRLFHTVGMPTFPYKYEAEYTLTTDNSRNPANYGFYTSLKEVPQRSKGESYTESTWQGFAMDDYVVRYTEVMLWRAEALIETGNIAEAINIINQIRTRANNSVAKYIPYAANQVRTLGYYQTGVSKEDARKYLRWEKRLEMAMEPERYFDLRRWGLASSTLNAFFASEKEGNYDGTAFAGYYSDAFFTAGKNEYWPIPYNQLFYVPGLYTQNKGYN